MYVCRYAPAPEIVGTFCAATTLIIATQKVQAFPLNSTADCELTLCDWTWTVQQVSFNDDGVAMTNLGLDTSHHLGHASAQSYVLAPLRCAAVLPPRYASWMRSVWSCIQKLSTQQ